MLCSSLLCLYSVLLLSVHTASSVSHASDSRCPDRVCLFVYHALSTCTCYASHDVLCALRFSFRRLRVSAPQGPRTGSSSYTYIHTVLQLRVSSYSTVFRLSTFTHGVMRGAITLSADIVGICIIFMLNNLGTLLVVHLTSSRRWVRVIIGSEGQGSHLDASVSGVVLGLSSRRFLMRAASGRLPPPEDLRRRDQDAR